MAKSKKKDKNKEVKAKFFYSVSLNKNKYDSLIAYAEVAKDVRNFISEYIHNDDNLKLKILLNTYKETDLKTELKDYRKQFKGILEPMNKLTYQLIRFKIVAKKFTLDIKLIYKMS